ncbi:hypothetical protein V1J52_06540 [Streptomyces sp. TRM 70351]|uniref:hypothetical protein n=1 Tax=Streptomyces sp. TRM 70351 TaxID=3116552 RepID=UPI002E7BEDCC|nr:hypothetical protein [Streptomyces sp. TRM 70351]MEE1927851.1 hypothetical protein [Streptomyces sp. TRM 70351]
MTRTDVPGAPPHLKAAAMDCVQVNLAVLSEHHHGEPVALNLGAPLRFAPRFPGDALPTVEPPHGEHLAVARTMAGVDVRGTDRATPVTQAWELAGESGGTHYVLADAFTLPWTPYHGHEHLEHSFLMTVTAPDRVHVVDAYHNDTPYGNARPGAWEFDRDRFQRELRGTALRFGQSRTVPVRAEAVESALADNARHLAAARDDAVPRYVAAYRDHDNQREAVEALVLETWLLARSRRLHGHWLAVTHPDSASRFSAHADDWAAFAGHCYLAARRVRRGRDAPSDLYERLAALLSGDADHARSLAAAR